MILDASVLLSAFFPDEHQSQAQALLRAHTTGSQSLKAPILLSYEVENAVWQAERRARIHPAQTIAILKAVEGLAIALFPPSAGESLDLARRLQCSVYDSAYLALALRLDEPLITADEKLFAIAKPHFKLIYSLKNYSE